MANKQNTTKEMYDTLFSYMTKLDENRVDSLQANAMAKLVKQASDLLNYELKRAVLMANPTLREHHRDLEKID